MQGLPARAPRPGRGLGRNQSELGARGPALLGAEITISIKLTNVDGRRVTFEATVNDGADAVASGTHERFIVDVQKVRERLLKKKAQRG